MYSLTNPTSTITGNSAANNRVTINNVPVGNYPVVIADQGIVLF